MLKMLNLRASLLASLLAMPLAGIAAFTLPLEADAQAQSSGGWRKEIADKVKSAQDAGKQGNFSEAIRLLKEAKAKAPLSPQEEQGVNEYLIYAASSAKDYRLVIATVDDRLATGRVTGADLVRKLRLKATTCYSLRDYRGAIDTFNKLSAAQGSLGADDRSWSAMRSSHCTTTVRPFRPSRRLWPCPRRPASRRPRSASCSRA